MYIERFIAHQTPAKARVFALTNDGDHGLRAVTTLSGDHMRLTTELVDALNIRLFESQAENLKSVLVSLPEPVQTAVRRFLHDAGDPDPCGYTELGPIDVVREFYFSDGSREIAEFLDAALMIGMGVRVSNEVDSDGVIDWRFELRSEEVFVPASAEPRSWLLPEGLRPISTWTSRESTGGDPVRAAFRIAQEAARQGRYVRIHTFACGASDDLDDTLTSEIAVDVLDAPTPLAQD
ncbi:hypothetical protein [Nocardiopsis dassonvillei]|uniref:hypothetical protein n=1 Tax=Nocardiopsis dassonvillei TaxID=2014 RepID=UPI00366F6F48